MTLTDCKIGIKDPEGDKLSSDFELIISEPIVLVDEGFSEANVDRSLTNVNVAVIGSFNNALTIGWSATVVFTKPATEGSWRDTAGIEC